MFDKFVAAHCRLPTNADTADKQPLIKTDFWSFESKILAKSLALYMTSVA